MPTCVIVLYLLYFVKFQTDLSRGNEDYDKITKISTLRKL